MLIAAVVGPASSSAPSVSLGAQDARARLGRLLFFDPALSADGTRSCAHCHRPARGMADGRRTPRALGGGELSRNTPSLYNAARRERLMWDQRAASLEDQALIPLLHPDEMGASRAGVIRRLRAIPVYEALFRAAFPDDPAPVNLRNLTRAIAAFERTLISAQSRFDRYVRGEHAALTAEEHRGYALFRSVRTRCFECHPPPDFRSAMAVSIGVPSDDPGVGAVLKEPALEGAFAVPSLRNVALTAPYMHDGSIRTLEDVVDFYRDGGGRSRGVPAARIHDHVRPFEISDADAAALVAFLGALTDESARPEAPERVPSGLPVLRERPPSPRLSSR